MNELFPYQVYGAEWLHSKRFALLADEMRVGKSPQSITACDMIGATSILILCPASARINWLREFNKWSILGRPQRALFEGNDEPLKNGVNVCSYDLAVQPAMLKRIALLSPDILILDESHYLKEPSSQRTHAAFGLHGLARQAKKIWCLTGTPMPNGLPSELWVLLHSFGVYPYKYTSFVNRFCTGYHDGYTFKITGAKNEDALKKLLKPIMLRRTMKEVRPEVPETIYDDVVVAPEPYYYTPPEDQIDVSEVETYVRTVLENTPPDDQAAALEAMSNESIATLRRYTGLAKVKGFIKLVHDDFKSGVKKLVVFAIHREVISRLEQELAQYNPIVLWGGVPAIKRQKKLDKFADDPHARIFIGQIQAVKENIDLSVANDGYILEPSWTPGYNWQASKRCSNVNKLTPVTMKFVSLAGSSDELVNRALMRKSESIEKVIGS